MKRHFTAAAMGIVVLALVISAVGGGFGLYLRQVETEREDLRELLNLVDAQGEVTDAAQAADLFRAAAPEKRLTVIAADGTVLADTGGDVTENHADRPEIQDALAEGWGEATRASATVGCPMLYVAKRFSDGVVGRAAVPLSTVDSLVWAAVPSLAAAALAALAAAFALSRYMARQLVKPLHAVGGALRDVLAGGDAGVLEQYEADEELRPILHDIRYLADRLRQSLQQLKDERDKVKEAESVRAQFTANVSHELKTPLTSIKGFSDMMAEGMVKDPEDQKRFLTMIGVEVDRLISLINDILEISELESVAIEEPAETSSPLEVAEEVRGLLADQAEKRGAVLAVRGEAGEARIPHGRLKELLLNLMENALKYGRESGGRVEVTVERQGEEFSIAVADNGIGIPTESQPHVFERFYRVDKGRSRQNGGTGLGLAIVKHIVQLYGGTLSLESELGAGSTFTVTLPAKA